MISLNAKESTWNTAIYIRLSQDDKEKGVSNSVINQKKLLNDYIDGNKELCVINTYIDDGYTGTNFNRPAFMRMMNDVKAGKVNCIVVKDLSRFGREHIDVDNYLERIFPLLGVRFVSVMQHLDSYKNPEKMNSIEVPFLNLINEEYSRDISRKTKASLETKRKEGKYVYSRAPYGYIKDHEDKYHLIVDRDKAENVREVYRKYMESASFQSVVLYMRSIAEKIGSDEKWSIGKVKKILSNRIYTGDMVQGITAKYNHKTKKRYTLPENDWIIVHNTHEAIVGKYTFHAVQKLLVLNTSAKSEQTKPSYLSRYLKCADCGKKLVRTSATVKGKIYRQFVCSTYKKLGKSACNSHIIDEEALCEIMLTTIQNQIKCVLDIEKVLVRTKEETINKREKQFYINKISHLEEELEKIKDIKRGLYKDYKDGILTLDEYEEMKISFENSCQDKLQEIDVQKNNLKKTQSQNAFKNKYIETFKKHKNIIELSREVIINLVEEIVVYRDKRINIIFKFQDEYKKLSQI